MKALKELKQLLLFKGCLLAKSILLIEDDDSLGATLSENLNLEGYLVNWEKNGIQGLESAKKNLFDLVVLDIMLPGISGLNILNELKPHDHAPILVISAKGTAEDRIRALELEADDYLPKPFHLKEFILRVQAIIRRSENDQTKTVKDRWVLGQAVIDFSALLIENESEKERLTALEAKVLKLLLSKANTVVSRDEIINSVWGPSEQTSTRSIDNFVLKFRKFIEKDSSQPMIIVSQRGVGYKLILKER